MKSFNRGFTMVELIIVATIIGILAAIAIPNFLAAKVRANTARARSEMEMLTIAIQSYYVDKGFYPLNPIVGEPSDMVLTVLTTPIVYITQLPKDPFVSIAGHKYDKYRDKTDEKIREGYGYVNYLQLIPDEAVQRPYEGGRAWYGLMSRGPDLQLRYDSSVIPPVFSVYDPTNGTTSIGDIYIFGP